MKERLQQDFGEERRRKIVDWLLCDVVTSPERTLSLVKDWLGPPASCGGFCVTIKFREGEARERERERENGEGPFQGPFLPCLQGLKAMLAERWGELEECWLRRLDHNRHEVSLFGWLKDEKAI